MKLSTYTVKVTKQSVNENGGHMSDHTDLTVTVKARNRRTAALEARRELERLYASTSFALTFRSITRHGDPRPWLRLNGGSSPRGADMGRFSFLPFDRNAPVRFHLMRMPLDSGGYDESGAYWGHGAPMFRAVAANEVPVPASYLNRAETRLDRPQWFTRAKSRAEAKALLVAEVPGARFYR